MFMFCVLFVTVCMVVHYVGGFPHAMGRGCFRTARQNLHYTQACKSKTVAFKMRMEESESDDCSTPLTDADKQTIVDKAKELAQSDRMALILNQDYGGYGLSKYAVNLYKDLYKDVNGVAYEQSKPYFNDEQLRTDPLMAQIVEANPKKSGERYSHLSVHYLNRKFKEYVHITDYDGAETATILEDMYILDKVRALDRLPDLNAEERVRQLHEILNEPIEKFYVSYDCLQDELHA